MDDFTVEDLSVYINEPSTVSIGEEFTFSVTISNESDEAKELRSIDIDRSFLEGMVVIGTTTPTTNEYYIEALDQDIFEFEHMIPAYEDLTLVFTAMAFIPGDYSGDFDICIDGDASCLFEDISVTIE